MRDPAAPIEFLRSTTPLLIFGVAEVDGAASTLEQAARIATVT